MSNLNVNGTGYIKPGKYDKIIVCGSANGNGTLEAEKIEVNGSLFFDGNIQCNVMSINGQIETQNIKADKLNIHGCINCNDVIAQEIRIESRNECRINYIKCNNCTVKYKLHALLKLSERQKININMLDAKSVNAYGLNAHKVICNSFTAGDKTHVNYLEYSDFIQAEDGVIIDEKIKK